MASNTTMLHVRVDEELKQNATAVLESFGLTISDAVRMLLKRIEVEDALPIALLSNNAEYDAWRKNRLQESINSPLDPGSLDDLYNDLISE